MKALLVSEKCMSMEEAVEQREKLKLNGEKLVLTNGCFDLLHAGHLSFLRDAAKLGSALWVGVNSDASVSQLKGETRPILPQEERVYALNALECVNGIFVFNGEDLSQELNFLKPDVYVKAGDYSLDSLNAKEREVLLSNKVEIKFLPFLKGLSTTNLIKKIKKTTGDV